jgi:hypothetical protein
MIASTKSYVGGVGDVVLAGQTRDRFSEGRFWV